MHVITTCHYGPTAGSRAVDPNCRKNNSTEKFYSYLWSEKTFTAATRIWD